MKNYKDYEKKYIGSSDIAALVLVGCTESGAASQLLRFGEDGSYSAYIVDEDAEIPAHYEKAAEFSSWLKIYDDAEFVRDFTGSKIEIFRVGNFGCIIKVAK